MSQSSTIELTSECTATSVGHGVQVTVPAGRLVEVVQRVGRSIIVRTEIGALLRIDRLDADALGLEPTDGVSESNAVDGHRRTVIPVRRIELGLVNRYAPAACELSHDDLHLDTVGRVATSQQSQRLAASDGLAVSQRWRPSAPLFAAGSVSIIAGGLAAAVTGPIEWNHGSWVAAFLVLVTGAGQIGLGAGQARLAPVAPSVGFTAVECALWNGGCLTVISGTLLSNPPAVSIGSGLLVAALGMSTFGVRGTGGQPLLLVLYRGLLIVLLASIPIGTALAWTKH